LLSVESLPAAFLISPFNPWELADNPAMINATNSKVFFMEDMLSLKYNGRSL
jgi:hypothetical protein